MLPLVSIIILQYNNSQDTIRCLNVVKELDYPNYNIVVIDNASSLHHLNSTRLFIENEKKSGSHSSYHLVPGTYNLGYPGGNNFGIKYALKHHADYVFILNPDATVEKKTLTNLIAAGESDTQIGILGPTINESGHIIYGGRIQWLRPELSHDTKYQILNTRYYIPGAAMLIKKEVIKKIGLFDERYFLYFEDTDYCVRTQRSGFKLTIVPEAKITHTGSASTSSLGAPLLLRYHFRNAHLFNWKNGPWWARITLPFWSAFIIIKQFFKIIFLPAKHEISRAILAGVVDFYRGRFGRIGTF